jgi:putative flippase GtrA
MELPAVVIKFIKFAIVGASGVLVDFAITYLAKEKFGIQKYVANALGFCCAATTNFFLNRNWTFENDDPQVAEQFIKFFLIATIGLGLNTVMIWFAHQRKGYNFYLAKAIAIALVMFWNFIANFLYTFVA